MSVRSSVSLCAFLAVAAVALSPHSALAQPGPAYVIQEAVYSAKAEGKKFEVEATYKIELLTKGLAAVRLLPPDAAITDFSTNRLPISSAKFLLRRAPTGCEAVLEERGKYEIKVSFVVKIDRSGRTARASVPFPLSTRNELNLRIPEPEIKIVTRPELPIEMTGETKSETSARLFPPAIEKVELEWYPKALAKELEAVVVAEERSFLTFGDGLVRRSTTVTYTVTRGIVNSLSLRLPAGLDVRGVTGELVDKWTRSGAGVEVKLKHEIEKTAQIVIETEAPAASAPCDVKIEPIVTADAGRQRGSMALLTEAGLALRHRAATGAQQVDIAAERFAAAKSPVRLAYAYDSLPVEITVGVEKASPKIASVVESRVHLERGVVTVLSDFCYDVKEIGVYEFKLKLYQGLSVLEVKGGALPRVPIRVKARGEGQAVSDDGVPVGVRLEPLESQLAGDVLTVRTRDRVTGRYFLQVTAQMNLVVMNGVVIPRIETQGVESEVGYLGISVGTGVNLQHHSAARTRQIDVSRLPEWLVACGCKIGYTYDQPDGALSVKTIKIEPEITAKEYQYIAVEEGWIKQEALYVLDVQRAGTFTFRIQVPKNLMVTEVRAQGMQDWTFKRDVGEVWVEVAAEVTGGYAFQVFAEQRIEDLTAEMALQGMEFVGAKKLNGWLGVGPRASVELRAVEAAGLEKIGAANMPEFYKGYPEMNLAYTYTNPSWRLRMRATVLESQTDAEVFSLLRFQSGLMTAVEEIHLDIRKAPIKEFEVVLPPKAVNSTVDGDDIKTSELVNGTWHITLRNKMSGALTVWVNYEQALGGASGQLPFTGVKLPKAREFKGFVVVAQEKSDAEIKLGAVRAVTPVDESALPEEFVKRVTIPIVRTFRFLGPERAIAFDVTSHARADVAKARAESCVIHTVVKPQGEAINHLSFNVLNSRKQFLKVNLGKGANLWGAYVILPDDPKTPAADEKVQPVKCTVDPDGAILAPILTSETIGKWFRVEIIWSNPLPKLGLMRTIDFLMPDPDVQVGSVEWDVHFPREYQIRGTSGNMQLASGGRDVSLVAILWSYIAAVLGVALNLLYGLLFPLVVLLIIGFLLLWVWLRMRWEISIGRALFWAVFVVFAAGVLYFFLPSFGRAREEARRMSPAYFDRALERTLVTEEPAATSSLRAIGGGEAIHRPPVDTASAPALSDEIGVRQQAPPAAPAPAPPAPEPMKPVTRYSSEKARELHEKMKRAGEKTDVARDLSASSVGGKAGAAKVEEAALQAPEAKPEPQQQMLLRKQTKSEAEEAQDQTKQVQKGEANQRINRALSNLKDNRLNEAVQDLEQAVALDKDNVQAKQQLNRVKGMMAVAGAQLQQMPQKNAPADLPKIQADGDEAAFAFRARKPAEKKADGKAGEEKAEVGGVEHRTGYAVTAEGMKEKLAEIRKLRAEGKEDEAKRLLDELRHSRDVGVEGLTGSGAARVQFAEEGKAAGATARPTTPSAQAPRPTSEVTTLGSDLDREKAVGKATMGKEADAKEIARAAQAVDLYETGKRLYGAGQWREARDTLRRAAGSGVNLGSYRKQEIMNLLAGAEKRIMADASMVLQAQVAAQQVEVVREGQAATMLTKIVGGQAKGALPIELTVPTAGTVPYRFEMPLAGDAQGRIRMSCIRIGAALCLQGIIGIVLLGAALGIGWRRPGGAAIVCAAVLVVLLAVQSVMASPASEAYYAMAVWALAAGTVILGVRAVLRERLRRQA